MNLLGYEITKRPPKGEVGVSGTTSIVSGDNIILSQEDYNPDLRGTAFFDQIDRMRLSDSQVKAVMNIVKLPLIAADWGIESASDDPQDVEIAEWIEDRFFYHQMRSWDYILQHMLLSLDYGVMPFETVWTVEQDTRLNRPMVHLRKLAPRMPRTIQEWRLDEEGQLKSIMQMAEKDGRFQEIVIPGDRLIVLVHDMEGANYRGTSILRQARKDWHIKERLQRINQVAIEKRAAGIDVGTLPERSNDEQKAAFEAVLQTIRTHERAYMVEPDGHKYRIEGITGSVLDPLPSIEYCDVMILRSILADFLVSGTSGERGALAMVRDRSSFFLMALGGIANEILAPINRDLIPKWVNWNWPNVKEYPRLTHSRLDRRDVAAVAEALKGLIPVGVITPDDGIEKEVRELLEMPDMPEDVPVLSKRIDKTLKPRTPLEKSVDWIALERGLDDAEAKVVRAYREVQDKQIEKVVDEAMKAITSEKGPDDKAEMLENINIPYKREVITAVHKALSELYGLGQREVRMEMSRMGGEPLKLAMPLDSESDSVIKRFLRHRAAAIVAVLASRLRGSLLTNGLNMIREGDTDRKMLQGTLEALSDRAIVTAARDGVSEALNLGRESVAKRNADLVEEAVYSAILDENACDACLPLDNTTYILGSQAYEDAKPPRPAGGAVEECHGRNRCRCTFIYSWRSEARPRA